MEPIFIIPDKARFQVQVTIPKQWIGTKLKIDIQFKPVGDQEIPNGKPNQILASDIFEDCSVDLSAFTFNRQEANEYN